MSAKLIYWLVSVTAFMLAWLPVWFSMFVAARAGDLVYVLGLRRKIGLENLSTAFGETISQKEKKRILRISFQNMAISVVELFLVRKMKKQMSRRFVLNGAPHLENAFAKGKGVILVISHLGSWEYLSFLPLLTHTSWSAVVRLIRNPYLNKKINSLRREMTLNPIPKKNAVKEVLRELKRNNGVAILIDQWAGPDGLWIPFFGKETSTTSLPVRLALRSGAVMMPAYCLRTSTGRYDIQLHPPVLIPENEKVDEAEITNQLNRLLENQILKYPEQWAWVHRRWKPHPSWVRKAS